jgi:hypothetical protein
MILRGQWKGHQKIRLATKQAIVHWIWSHKNVVTSPKYNEKQRARFNKKAPPAKAHA